MCLVTSKQDSRSAVRLSGMGSDPANKVSSSDGISQGLQKMPVLHGRTTGPTRRSTKGQWTEEEDEILRKAVQRFKGKNWKKIDLSSQPERKDAVDVELYRKMLTKERIYAFLSGLDPSLVDV
ncbi:Homeodomain-like protein [Cynara cardunculus var. scolymus]|uniref:Homeodomain-like protein n=1 Tax=Cynara cardunculus var. scolymus TaxID=59895 RepID=A0A118J4F8_CYNCS|nr:Homeodomain-like protein [Cynara cardunculus var. scolymus]